MQAEEEYQRKTLSALVPVGLRMVRGLAWPNLRFSLEPQPARGHVAQGVICIILHLTTRHTD